LDVSKKAVALCAHANFHNPTINGTLTDATRITKANAATREAIAAKLLPLRFNAGSRARHAGGLNLTSKPVTVMPTARAKRSSIILSRVRTITVFLHKLPHVDDARVCVRAIALNVLGQATSAKRDLLDVSAMVLPL
jgi:hypothetical protein